VHHPVAQRQKQLGFGQTRGPNRKLRRAQPRESPPFAKTAKDGPPASVSVALGMMMVLTFLVFIAMGHFESSAEPVASI